MLAAANANRPKGEIADDTTAWTLIDHRSAAQGRGVPPLIVAYHNGAAVRLSDVAEVQRFGRERAHRRHDRTASRAVLVIIFRQPGANIIDTVDRVMRPLPALQASIPAGDQADRGDGPHHHHPRLGARRGDHAC